MHIKKITVTSGTGLTLDEDGVTIGEGAKVEFVPKKANATELLRLSELLARAKRLESALTDEDLASNSPALAESQQALKDYHKALEKAFA